MALTHRSTTNNDALGSGATFTSAAIAIGTASSDRWVIVKCWASLFNATDFTVDIGGVTATQIGSTQDTTQGAILKTYVANVTTGTTATVAFNGNSGGSDSFYEVDFGLWTEDAGEPTLNDQAIDFAPTSGVWSVSVDIPSGGLAVGLAVDNFNSGNATWTGLTERADTGTRMLTTASDDSMTAETGRTISVSADSGAADFQDALYVTSFNAPGGAGVTVALDAGSYSLTGNNLTVTTAETVALDAGSYSFTGQATTETFNFSVPLDAGSFSFAGNDLALQLSIPVSLDAGSYSLTGFDLGVAAGLTIPLDAGSYSITGNDLGLTTNTAIALDAGSYTLTGFDITLQEGVNISLDSGAYSFTGQDLTTTTSIAVNLDAGGYTLTGLDLGVSTGRIVALETGTYTLTGQDLAVQAGISVSLATGVYSFTGFDVTSIADGQSVARVAGFADSKTGGVLSDSLTSGSFTNTPNGGTLTEARNV